MTIVATMDPFFLGQGTSVSVGRPQHFALEANSLKPELKTMQVAHDHLESDRVCCCQRLVDFLRGERGRDRQVTHREISFVEYTQLLESQSNLIEQVQELSFRMNYFCEGLETLQREKKLVDQENEKLRIENNQLSRRLLEQEDLLQGVEQKPPSSTPSKRRGDFDPSIYMRDDQADSPMPATPAPVGVVADDSPSSWQDLSKQTNG